MSYVEVMARINELQSSALLSAAPPVPVSVPVSAPEPMAFQQHMEDAQAAASPRSASTASGYHSGVSGPTDVELLIASAADRHGVDRNLVRAVVRAESNFNQDVTSSAGAVGLMQLMPQTAAGLGVNPHVASENVDGGVKYLKQMLDKFDGDVRLALAGYNAGPGAVDRHNGIPPYRETQQYVAKITAELRL